MADDDLILTPKLRPATPVKLDPRKRLFTEKQLGRESIDRLKRFLRSKLDNYRVAIRSITPSNRFYRGVRHSDIPKAGIFHWAVNSVA
jgi:hypothetical protein